MLEWLEEITLSVLLGACSLVLIYDGYLEIFQ